MPVEIVLCYAPDRLARRYAYQALLVEELARAGTEVCFLNGPTGDRPEDALLVQFQGMIAEYEKAQIIERTRRGKAHRAKAGSVNVLSGAPYGYRYVRKSDHAEARYELVEPQATVVRELFGVAQRDVIVSTFVVRQAAAVFRPLAERMHQAPDLRVRLFLHVGRE